MKEIAIVGYPDKIKNYRNILEALNCKVVNSFDIDIIKNCTSLLLPGGGDIAPEYYNEKSSFSNPADNFLDDIQFKALNYFVNNNKAVLGICRGIQIINVYFGGNLIQDLKNKNIHMAKDEKNNIDNSHLIYAKKNSFLEHLYSSSFMVNSWHHQAVNELGNGLEIVAKAQDDVVEAIKHKYKNIIAFQFHPERMCLNFKNNDLVDGTDIFKYFIGEL